MSCSSLLPVEDAARLIEEICNTGAIDNAGEVLAAFDLGEHLSQCSSAIVLAEKPRSLALRMLSPLHPCCARAGASRELQSTEQEMMPLEDDAMVD